MPQEAQSDIAAIFARLKDEVRNSAVQPATKGVGSPAYLSRTTRLRAERSWSVSADRPFQSPPDEGVVRRFLAAPVKRVLRKSMRWYVEPLAAEQRSFNLAMLTLVDELAEQAHAGVTRLEHRLQALEERHLNDGTEPDK